MKNKRNILFQLQNTADAIARVRRSRSIKVVKQKRSKTNKKPAKRVAPAKKYGEKSVNFSRKKYFTTAAFFSIISPSYRYLRRRREREKKE